MCLSALPTFGVLETTLARVHNSRWQYYLNLLLEGKDILFLHTSTLFSMCSIWRRQANTTPSPLLSRIAGELCTTIWWGLGTGVGKDNIWWGCEVRDSVWWTWDSLDNWWQSWTHMYLKDKHKHTYLTHTQPTNTYTQHCTHTHTHTYTHTHTHTLTLTHTNAHTHISHSHTITKLHNHTERVHETGWQGDLTKNNPNSVNTGATCGHLANPIEL